MPSNRDQKLIADRKNRQALCGGYYWFPGPNGETVTWEVLTCHELGFDAEVGHIDLWPSVLDRLATAWGKDKRLLRILMNNHYTGLPRGRVTRPKGTFLILHGRDAPVADWERRVIQRFDLDRRSVRAVFDEHERMLPGDRRKVNEVLGIGA
jgi:hypothetical protein